ncbi:UvrD-helicase domain-containing protein [Patescibacteria group bacterium]|nr:UvrD-helicase domain-containing protein [Patescibacteria group bacterium]MCL5091723.1 UvrD-helicase domain-containing protein [Patescibacteria group bacterium]
MDQAIFKKLNRKQQEAVKQANGPSLILAGAGSGKTRVLVYKVLHLIKNHGIDPRAIVMITFTNKAAGEMRSRINQTLGYSGTFHAFCCMVLRRFGPAIGVDREFVIYDEDDQKSLIKSVLKQEDVTQFSPAYFLNRISAAKSMLIGPERYQEIFSDYQAARTARIYQRYQRLLGKNQAVDFDDLIMQTVALFTSHPDSLAYYQRQYRYLLVDEFQDTNFAQYQLVRWLAGQEHNVTVVGDFSQSIYSWRGADIRNLEKFQTDFPETKTYYLEQNYRSTQKILDFAHQIIEKNQTHPILQLFTTNVQGEAPVFHVSGNAEGEALFVADEIQRLQSKYPAQEIAVLYRTNAQSRLIEEVFLRAGINYTLIGGTRFYERKEIKDVLAYLRLLINVNDSVARARGQKLGKRRWSDFLRFRRRHARWQQHTTDELMNGIFSATGYLQLYDIHNPEDYARLENIKELRSVALGFPDLGRFLEQVALVESEYFEKEKRTGHHDGVRLMTLHQVKGLEFAVVFVVGLEEGLLPHSRSLDDNFQLEEERRLFYVGVTRAKQRLYLTRAQRRFIFGSRVETMPSRFISDYTMDNDG